MEKEKIPQELIIPASEHPKAFEPAVLILNIVMCCLGAIIGLELIVRTGVTPNTSIVGALFAILISRIPIAFLQKYRSVHRQNLIQTSISGATFSAANCLILPIGIQRKVPGLRALLPQNPSWRLWRKAARHSF